MSGKMIERDVSHGSNIDAPAPWIAMSGASRALFWRARFLQPSPSLAHLPFLFWLCETARPRSIVSLGLNDGVAYMGLCQAVDRLGLDATCHGIDAFAATDGTPPAAFFEAHAAAYAEFSTLLTTEPSAAGRRFPRGRIDLLHVALIPADVDEADQIVAQWLPRLSERGVIVMAGVDAMGATVGGRHLLDRLEESHSALHFEQGGGLALLLHGAQQPDRLQTLATLGVGATGWSDVLRVFTRLGHAHATEADLAAVQAGLAEVRRSKADSETTRTAQAKRITDLEAAYEERSHLLASVQIRLQAADEAALRTAAACTKLEADLATAYARLSDAEAKAGQLPALRSELSEARDIARRRGGERDALHANLAEKEAQHAATDAALTTAQAETAALRAELEEARTTASAIQQELNTEKEKAAELPALRSELSEARDIARRRGGERDALHANLAEKEAQHAATDAALTTAQAETAALRAELEEARTTASAIQQELNTEKEKAAELPALRSELSEARDIARRRGGERDALHAKLAEKEAQHAATDAALTTAQAETAALRAELEEARTTASAIQQELNVEKEKAENQQAEAEAHLAQARAEGEATAAPLRQALAEMASKFDNLDSERASMALMLDERMVQDAALRAELEEARTTASAIQQELNVEKEKAENQQAEAEAHLAQARAEGEATAAPLRQALAEMASKFDNLDSERASMALMLDERMAEIVTMTALLEGARAQEEETGLLRKQVVSLKERLEERQQKSEALRADLHETRAQLRSLEESAAAATQAQTELMDHIAVLTAIAQEPRGPDPADLARLATLESTNIELQAELERKTEQARAARSDLREQMKSQKRAFQDALKALEAELEAERATRIADAADARLRAEAQALLARSAPNETTE